MVISTPVNDCLITRRLRSSKYLLLSQKHHLNIEDSFNHTATYLDQLIPPSAHNNRVLGIRAEADA